MSDIFEPKARSYIMSRIRKKDTKPELTVRKYLFRHGFRFRIHDDKIVGNPDIVLKKYKTLIFINGCFWHAHKGCKLNKPPKSNLKYWLPKINKNVERDENNLTVLKDQGWTVITIWECELKGRSENIALDNLVKTLSGE
jgi:DNA mismatch endonuclease, patch repair protein